jgi:dephospho-CoA kinase
MTPPGTHDPAAKPRVVGLTGGIASGKTTVSTLLAQRGAYIVDADAIGHQVILPDGEAYPEVVAAFGPEILEEDGTISRRKLGAIVFAEPARLAELNAISHPRMGERMARVIKSLRRREPDERPPLIVLDAAILFEAAWDTLCDEVWTVESPPDTAIERLVERNRMTRQEALSRLDAQISNEERARRAHRIIRNEGSLEALADTVARLWEAITRDD